MRRLIRTDNGAAPSLSPAGTSTREVETKASGGGRLVRIGTEAEASGNGRLVRIGTEAAPQSVQTASSPAPDYRRAVELNRLNHELN